MELPSPHPPFQTQNSLVILIYVVHAITLATSSFFIYIDNHISNLLFIFKGRLI